MIDPVEQSTDVGLGMVPALADNAARRPGRSLPDAATIRAARAFRRRIEGRYPVRELLLFGSRARGTHHAESDADLAVVLSGDGGARARIAGEMAEVAFDVLMETGILVQALPLWEGDLRQPERFSNPALLASIRREGLRL